MGAADNRSGVAGVLAAQEAIADTVSRLDRHARTAAHAASPPRVTLGTNQTYWFRTSAGNAMYATAPENEALSAEEARQIELLRYIFGNPCRPSAFDPSWRTDTVVSLARTMYEARDFSAMPILADALQDAGCDNEEILNDYFDIKPRRPADQREFARLVLALYRPRAKAAKWAYLPAQMNVDKPNEDQEQWRFTDPKVDVRGDAKAFQFEEIKDKGWTFHKAPPQPSGGMPRP